MIINHPHLGPRDASEFTILGDASLINRPDWQAGDADDAFYNYQYLRDNPAGLHRELWFHEQGDRSWLVVTRDTVTHAVIAVALASDIAKAAKAKTAQKTAPKKVAAKKTAAKKANPKKTPAKKTVVKKKAPAATKQPVENTVEQKPILQKIKMPKTPTRENGTVVLVTGGFDPLHSGHLDYIDAAKDLGRDESWHGSKVVVGVNSDEWLERKKGKCFMPVEERVRLLLAIRNVDQVITFDDSDDSSMNAIHITRHMFPDEHIIFANGGDRTNTTTPEYATYGDMPNVEFAFGVGGTNKMNSSSWILDEWKTQKTERDWGYWRVLDDKPEKGYKVKELVILPGKRLSDQRHKYRSEMWYVTQGQVSMAIQIEESGEPQQGFELPALTNGYNIGSNIWHKAMNNQDVPAHVIEVQYGEKCIEEDIERRD